MYIDSGGAAKLKDIAAQLGLSDTQIRKWKSIDKWDEHLNSNATIRNGNVTHRKQSADKRAAVTVPLGDGGITTVLFRKFLPSDEETLEIFDATAELSLIEMLWISIRILWTNIVRSQKITFVRDKQDQTRVITKNKQGDTMSETQWEYQHAWDRQDRTLAAQSAAMVRLAGLVSQYEEMLRTMPPEQIIEEHRLRVAKLRSEIAKINGDDGPVENDGFIEALKGKASEVWSDESDEDI
jgi:uncharacterized protein YjcR